MAKETENLAGKLARIMGEIGAIKPEGRNEFHRYDYITEGQLSAALKGKLAEAGIWLKTSVEKVELQRVTNQKGNEETLATVYTKHTFIDSATGEREEADGCGQGIDPGDKAVYKGETGAVKYFIMKNMLISDHSDPEADEGTDERASGKRKHSPYHAEKEPEKSANAAADAQMLREWMKQESITEDFVMQLAKEGKLSKNEATLDELKAGTLTRLLSWRPRIKERWLLAQANIRPGSEMPEKASPKPEQENVHPPPRKRYSGKPSARGRTFVKADDAHPVDFLQDQNIKHWTDVPIHFGQLEGTLLGRLDEDDLQWWITNYQPKQFRGKWNTADLILDAALCAADKEKRDEQEGRVYGNS